MGKTRQYIPLTEVPERWPVSASTLRRLVHERRPRYYKPGEGRSAKVYFDPEDLDKYFEDGRVEPVR